MYVCSLHTYAYMKYAYAYNWAAYVGPVYAYMNISPDTLIQVFYFYFFVSLI